MNLRPLKKLHRHAITKEKAYSMLKAERGSLKKARFIKLRMDIAESKGASRVINTLFFAPVPLALIKPFLRFIKDDDARMLVQLISYAKGVRIDVKSKDAHIHIQLY